MVFKHSASWPYLLNRVLHQLNNNMLCAVTWREVLKEGTKGDEWVLTTEND
jgi:hypothetical protein